MASEADQSCTLRGNTYRLKKENRYPNSRHRNKQTDGWTDERDGYGEKNGIDDEMVWGKHTSV